MVVRGTKHLHIRQLGKGRVEKGRVFDEEAATLSSDVRARFSFALASTVRNQNQSQRTSQARRRPPVASGNNRKIRAPPYPVRRRVDSWNSFTIISRPRDFGKRQSVISGSYLRFLPA